MFKKVVMATALILFLGLGDFLDAEYLTFSCFMTEGSVSHRVLRDHTA